jgi:hypothetical protein
VATSIVINGRRTSKPGAKSQVKSQTGGALGASARGVVAILGTAEGGKPLDASSTFADATSPDGARRKWRGGNLRNAALFAFAPSSDDAIPGGAQKVIGVKVNPATQSLLQLFDAEGSPAALATSRDYGAFTERISVDVESGTSLGKRVIFDLDSAPEEFDNLGGGSIMRVLTTPRWSAPTLPATRGTLGHVRRFLHEAVVFGGSVFASDAAASAAPFPAGGVTAVSTNAGDTMDVTVYGLDASGDPQEVTVALNGTTPVVVTGSWTEITGMVLDAAPLGQVSARDSAPLARITIGPTQRRQGVSLNRSTETLTGRSIRVWASFDPATTTTRTIVIRGTDSTDTALSEVVTLTGAAPITLTGDFKSITSIETGAVALGTQVFLKVLASTVDYVEYDMILAPGVVASPLASLTAATVTFTPTGAGNFTATVRGLNPAGAYITNTVVVTNAPVATADTFRKVLGIEITVAPTMPIAISGAFVGSLPVSTASYGSTAFDTLTTVPTGAPVYVRARSKLNRVTVAVSGVTVGGTPETLIVELNGDRPILVSDEWALITRLDYLQVPSAASVELLAPFLTVSGSTYNTAAKMVAKLNAEARIEASLQDSSETNAPFNQMDSAYAQTDLTDGADFYADLRKQINGTSGSEYAVLTRDAWSSGPLGNIGAPRYLVGGIEGVATITEWTAAFRALKKRRATTVIVLTEDPAVHQLLFNYVRDCVSVLENEANGYVGLGTTDGRGETRANIKSRIRALQGRNLSFVSQEFLRADPDTGEATWWPPYMLTSIAAGMQAGSAIGEPLTKKLPQLDDVRNDSSWSVEEDVEEMIDSGLMMIESDDNAGISWVRSITGHLADNDPVFCEMSAVESLNTFVYEFRAEMNEEIGKRALAPTTGNIKSRAVSKLTDAAAIDGEPIIRDWKPDSLAVEEIGDTFPVTVEVMPILGVNFIPITVNVGVTRTTLT